MSRLPAWAAPVASALIALGLAGQFLPAQCLWLDESAQLAGLGLGPAGVVRWLAGGGPYDTGQFPDRMPPGSYWAGQAWIGLVGPGEAGLRWFGALCLASAAAATAALARRCFGPAAGWAAGLMVATAPGLVVLGVEIRAYPLYLLLATVATGALVGWIDRDPSLPDCRRWAAVAAALAATASVHFFGLTLAGAGMVAAWAFLGREPARRRELVALTLVVAMASAALIPFARAAMRLGSKNPGEIPVLARVEEVGKLVPALFAHPSLRVDGTAQAAVLVGLAVLAGLAIRSRPRAGRVPALALAAGLAVVAAAEIRLGGRPRFHAGSPTYNLWARPALVLLATSGLAAPDRRARRAAGAAAALVIAGQVWGVGILERHRERFNHGPHALIAAAIREQGLGRVAVVHDSPGTLASYAIQPLRTEFGDLLDQYAAAGPGPVTRLNRPGLPSGPVALDDLAGRALVVVRVGLMGEAKLAEQVRGPERPIPPGGWLRAGSWKDRWRRGRTMQHVAAVSGRVDVLEPIEPRPGISGGPCPGPAGLRGGSP